MCECVRVTHTHSHTLSHTLSLSLSFSLSLSLSLTHIHTHAHIHISNAVTADVNAPLGRSICCWVGNTHSARRQAAKAKLVGEISFTSKQLDEEMQEW